MSKVELWIRSQDKDLLQRINTNIHVKKGLSEYAKGDVYIVVGSGSNLGEYETEERALEVLDEIEKYKDKLDKAYFLGMTESEFVSAIFQMPKE